MKDYSDYTSFTGSSTGKFTWPLEGSGALTDPDGYANKTPAQILELLLGKAVISTGGNGGGSTTTTKPTTGTAPTITVPSLIETQLYRTEPIQIETSGSFWYSYFQLS